MSVEGIRYPLDPNGSLTPCDVSLCRGGKLQPATIDDMAVARLRCERCKGTGYLGVTIDVWLGSSGKREPAAERWYAQAIDPESDLFLQCAVASTLEEVLAFARRAFGEGFTSIE